MNYTDYEFYNWVRGICSITVLVTIYLGVASKKQYYYYYGLRVLFITLFFFRNIAQGGVREFLDAILIANIFFHYHFKCLYILSLFDVKSNDYERYVMLKRINFTILLGGLFFIIFNFYGGVAYQISIAKYAIPIYFVFLIPGYSVFIRHLKEKIYLFLYPSMFMDLCIVVSLVLAFWFETSFQQYFGIHPIFIFYFGVFVQTIFYSVYINYYLVEKEEKINRNELILVNKSKELSEFRIKTLRSRLEADFIHSSMNIIKNKVIHRKTEEAINYITNLSKLLRNILNSSVNDDISLKDELTFLKNYVSLEKEKLIGDVSLEIDLKEDFEIENVKVLPMFMQPFIEKILWDSNNGKDKKILIELEKKMNIIQLSVYDNAEASHVFLYNEGDEGLLKKEAKTDWLNVVYYKYFVASSTMSSSSQWNNCLTFNIPIQKVL